jgi:hypothetical protein
MSDLATMLTALTGALSPTDIIVAIGAIALVAGAVKFGKAGASVVLGFISKIR